jgi:Xaa-Pro aminopeptidase
VLQSFNSITNPEQGPPRLSLLRSKIIGHGLDGFLVPRTDCHQGEYVAAHDERLSWLTGFTGSAGFACILNDKAGLFVDSRYRLQVQHQVASMFTPVNWPEIQLHDWLQLNIKTKAIIGFDPWLHTVAEIEVLEADLVDSNIKLRSCQNLIDTIWTDRPPASNVKAWDHPLKYNGEDSISKINKIAIKIKSLGGDLAIFTLPDSICWLLNIRGADVTRTPIVHCFAALSSKGEVTVFGDQKKLKILNSHNNVKLLGWNDFEGFLSNSIGKVVVDRKSLPVAALRALEKGVSETLFKNADLCSLPKACKNKTEIEGARKAHIRDGAAMVSFLAWFETADHSKLDEIKVVKTLESFRKKTNLLHDISFDTISGSGPNAAIVHYKVTHETNRKLDSNSLLLIDSGAQYFDGTTDVTRTLPLGCPNLKMRQTFTRVLQGMIAVSQIRFPKGITGRELDPLARAPLWMAGQDYDHGTGHGVGNFLSVHEGPQRISRMTDVELRQGMIISNEPGYYDAENFGIRIENLLVVQPAPMLPNSDPRDMWEFETLTYVPINKKLIEINLLTAQEILWLNSYHNKILMKLAPLIDLPTKEWLVKATSPI